MDDKRSDADQLGSDLDWLKCGVNTDRDSMATVRVNTNRDSMANLWLMLKVTKWGWCLKRWHCYCVVNVNRDIISLCG